MAEATRVQVYIISCFFHKARTEHPLLNGARVLKIPFISRYHFFHWIITSYNQENSGTDFASEATM